MSINAKLTRLEMVEFKFVTADVITFRRRNSLALLFEEDSVGKKYVLVGFIFESVLYMGIECV